MKRISQNLFFTVLATTQVLCNASNLPNVPQYIAKQGWTHSQSKIPALPVTDIAPVMYMVKGSFAPSCGLLTQTGAATVFFEISGPEPGEGFPQCLAINDVEAFDLNKKKYLVFEYINRDTREDVYRGYFYVYKDASGRYVADKELNDSDAWPASVPASSSGVNAPRAKEGVKRARGTMLSKSVPGMKFLDRDFIADETRSFALFHDKAKEQCAFVVDAGTGPAKFGHGLFSEGDKCSAVLASSKLEQDGKTYYLAMFKGASKNHLGVVSVSKDNVIAAERSISMAANRSGKLTDMKAAKKAVAASL